MDIALAASKNIAFSIAAAQSSSVPLDVEANVQDHLRYVEAAAAQGVQWLVFPELSLTGYELEAMPDHVLHAGDAVLAPLRAAAQRTGMAITVGAPLASGTALPFIGALTLHPDGRHAAYAKHHLHDGETRFATAGAAPVHLQPWSGWQIASAICADTNHPSHAAAAAQAGATVYSAGILTSAKGYAAEAPLWARYAREHRMTVLIANHGGPAGGYQSVGLSGIWTTDGQLLVQAQGTGDCLVIAKAAS